MCLLEQISVWQLNIKMISLVTAPDLVNFQACCYTENWIWLEFYNLSFCDWKWLNNIKIPNGDYSIQINASMLKILWLHSSHWKNTLKTKEIGRNRSNLNLACRILYPWTTGKNLAWYSEQTAVHWAGD